MVFQSQPSPPYFIAPYTPSYLSGRRNRREDKSGAERTHGAGWEGTAPAGHSPTAPEQGRTATVTGPTDSPGLPRPQEATSRSQGQVSLDEQGTGLDVAVPVAQLWQGPRTGLTARGALGHGQRSQAGWFGQLMPLSLAETRTKG